MGKRFFKSFVVTLFVAIFGLFSVTVYADVPGEEAAYDEVIAIVHTNDVHGNIEVEPYVKGLADQLKASGEYSLVLTVSAGDVYSAGQAVAGYYDGELIPSINDLVYDVAAPGNNDFPTGIEGNLLLGALYKNTKIICSNIILRDDMDVAAWAAGYEPKMGKEDFAALYDGVELNEDGSLDLSGLNLGVVRQGTCPWEPTMMFTTDKGTKVGLFGLTCTLGQMAGMADSQGSIQAAQDCTASLREEGANVVVGLAHTGWMGEGSEEAAPGNDTNSWLIANAVQDMDALIDSHTHSIINDGHGCYVGENGVLVNQAECFGDCIGIMYFYLKDGKVVDKESEVLLGEEEIVSKIDPDEDVQAMVDAALARIDEIAGPVLVTTPYFLNGERLGAQNPGGSIRGNETNLGDFVTDVLLKAASEKCGVDFEFTFFPGYWLRSSVDQNVGITKIEIASIFGMPTRLVYQEYSAKDILDLVTEGVSNVYPQKENITFYQFSGITATYANDEGTGTPASIWVGDTLIYDARQGGIQVDDTWKAIGLRTLHKDNADWTGDEKDIVCHDVEEVRELFRSYLENHELGVDYNIYPNEVAPDSRVVEVNIPPIIPEDPGWHQTETGEWYFCNEEGLRITGWLLYNGDWYYLDPETSLMQTGWTYINRYWYYLNPSSGAMVTGWAKTNNVWYYLHSNGKMAQYEWIDGWWLDSLGAWTYNAYGSWRVDSKGWWFGDTNGWYAKDGVETINGVDYWFDANGYWIPDKK